MRKSVAEQAHEAAAAAAAIELPNLVDRTKENYQENLTTSEMSSKSSAAIIISNSENRLLQQVTGKSASNKHHHQVAFNQSISVAAAATTAAVQPSKEPNQKRRVLGASSAGAAPVQAKKARRSSSAIVQQDSKQLAGTEQLGGQSAASTPLSSRPASRSANICAACQRPIRERYLLVALDKQWHEDCLKCSCCECRLGEVGSSLFMHSNQIFCRRDFLRIFCRPGQCAACDKDIPPYEMVMRAQENAYHMDCFACQQCQYRFCVGDQFHLSSAHRIVCMLCYQDQLQILQRPISQQELLSSATPMQLESERVQVHPAPEFGFLQSSVAGTEAVEQQQQQECSTAELANNNKAARAIT